MMFSVALGTYNIQYEPQYTVPVAMRMLEGLWDISVDMNTVSYVTLGTHPCLCYIIVNPNTLFLWHFSGIGDDVMVIVSQCGPECNVFAGIGCVPMIMYQCGPEYNVIFGIGDVSVFVGDHCEHKYSILCIIWDAPGVMWYWYTVSLMYLKRLVKLGPRWDLALSDFVKRNH